MTELATQIEAIGTKISEFRSDFQTRLSELEKRAANQNDSGGRASGQTLGEKLVATSAFSDLNGGRSRGRAAVEMAAITSADTTVGAGRSASTSLVPAHRLPGIVYEPERKLTVRDLIASGQTGSNSIEYTREAGFDNKAAPVAEGALKPYSDLSFDLVSAPVRTLAHLFKISKQMLDDAPAIRDYIDVRGRYGLLDLEDRQLLFGDGVGQNLNGLIPQATSFDDALRKTGDQQVDTIRRAILQVRRAQYRADGIVMSPTDWADIELLKETTGAYLWSNPIVNNGQNLWGIPVVDCDVMPDGEFLVGAFGVAAQVWDRQQVTGEISTENSDDFERNLATIRIEERVALTVYRPASFVSGSFEA